MHQVNGDEITSEEIYRRQEFARNINIRIAGLVSNDSALKGMVDLIIWNGSLPRGDGGNKYDFDYGVFLRAVGARNLLEGSEQFISALAGVLPEFIWREDLHYDVVRMFEAHTHWDPKDPTLPHIGMHFYQASATNELLQKQTWRIAQEGRSSFFFELDAWRRFYFYFRHWVYEGIAVYDTQSMFEQMNKLDFRLPEWMQSQLEEAVACALAPYNNSAEGLCTVSENRNWILDMLAMLAYAGDARPMGRATRYLTDMKYFRKSRSKKLLQAVLNNNLTLAAHLFR